MWNEDGITQSRHCKFKSSFLKCFLKMGSESQMLKIYNFHCKLKLSVVEGLKHCLLQSHDGWKRWTKVKPFVFVFCFVCSQAAASGGGARSGVHQRCQCQSLPGHEGGRQIAGLGKQHLPDVSLLLCPALALCGVAFLPAGLTQLLVRDLSGEMSSAQLLSVTWNRN